MKYNKGKDRFRAKIKIILKKLVRAYGFDTIAPLVPEKDARLMTHMRKLSERAARRKAAGVQDGSNDDARNDFGEMMDSDEDDSDAGRTLMTGVTGFTKMTGMSGKVTKRSVSDKSVKSRNTAVSGAKSTMTSKSARISAELNGEILDMLDASKMARSVHFADAHMNEEGFSEEDDDDDGVGDILFDKQGKMVITDGMQKLGKSKQDTEHYASDDEENLELKMGSKRRRVSKLESVKLARKAEQDAAKEKQKSKRERNSSSIGTSYKSKKSGGDVKRKGQKYDPYAYIPLNAKDYSKKNRKKTVSNMGSVVRGKRKRG